MWLNGVEEEIKPNGRTATCIVEMKRLRANLEAKNSGEPQVRVGNTSAHRSTPDQTTQISQYHVHIASKNNFPTAAGLASSASGFAALVKSLAALYQLPSTPSELSLIARQGSGSACRSLFGGFVAWEMGSSPDGSDSLAVEVAPRDHWPSMHALICVVSDDKKGTSSTSGMQRTVETSPLLQHRIKHVVPERMKAISKAIQACDFHTFARITMQDSNQFHAVALDTDPPIFYMNDVSRAIISLIVEYNRVSVDAGGSLKAAYTYDAGPNAVIYTLKENVKEIIELIVKYFPQNGRFKDPFDLFGTDGVQGKVVDGFNTAVVKPFGVGAIKDLIHTQVGDGPRVIGHGEGLLGVDGWPMKA